MMGRRAGLREQSPLLQVAPNKVYMTPGYNQMTKHYSPVVSGLKTPVSLHPDDQVLHRPVASRTKDSGVSTSR